MRRGRAPAARRRADDGAVAVEFVLIATLLIVLVMGVVNFAVVLSQQQALNHAVREAARAAVVPSTGQYDASFDLADEVRANAATLGIDTDAITVITTPPDCGAAGYGNDLLVEADYAAQFPAPMPIPGFSGSIDLSARASFRCEWE